MSAAQRQQRERARCGNTVPLLSAVKAQSSFWETHCYHCEAPHSDADLERNRCPECGQDLDPFRA